MKTMRKLQVAIAAGVMCAGSAMAANISQSGVTVAREVISANTAATQKLRAPTLSYSFDNGPTANALSTQDFNVTLMLGGDGAAQWDAQVATYKTVAAYRRNNGNLIVPVLPVADLNNVPAGAAALVLLSVDVWPALDGTNANEAAPATNKQKYRYKFRLVNNSPAPLAIGDLQLVFNGANAGDGTVAPFVTGLASVAPQPVPAATDYALVTNLANAVNAVTVSPPDTSAGVTGNVDNGCGEQIRKVNVLGRNYIGAGEGIQGESQGANTQQLLNGGYIQFNTALAVQLAQGVAVNRNTDPLFGNQQLTTVGAANDPLTMALGTVQFGNRIALDAFDTSLTVPYYKFGVNDLDGVADETNGDVDVANVVALRLRIESTNGFAPSTQIGLSDTPQCTGVNTVFVSPTWDAGGNVNATADFSLAQLGTVFGAANSLTNVGAVGPIGSPFFSPAQNTPGDRGYICMKVSGGDLIPQSRFQSAVATLYKNHTVAGIGAEQANKSCPANLAGLGGGIKIDIRNYSEFPDNSPWRTYVRVINNSETQTADVWAQYIRADGNYGRYVKLFDLPPRAARFLSDVDIRNLMASQGQVSASRGVVGKDGYLSDGVYSNANARLRISSDAASTLRVQNYLVNAATGLLTEVSGNQGADFVNVESSPRDHIDQDAQTGIKK